MTDQKAVEKMEPPSAQDIEAMGISLQRFMALPILRMNEGEVEVHNFAAGFYRGMAWEKSKTHVPRSEAEVLRGEISEKVRVAVEAERERCAVMAERLAEFWTQKGKAGHLVDQLRGLAAAIRLDPNVQVIAPSQPEAKAGEASL